MQKFITFIFILFGLSTAFVLSSQKAQAASIPHPDGTLIVDNGAIFIITNQRTAKVAVDSPAKLFSHHYSFGQAVASNTADQALPTNSTLGWGDGILLEENSTIYQIENQQKKGFASAEVFLGLGYKFENVFSANLVDVPFAKLIDNSDQAHSNGIFVIDQEGRVWYLEQGQRRPVPNPQTLFSYNLTFDQLIPANQA
ncbi:MAG: hypothetical protein R3B41_04330, partial [Candidatus Doudnabacteria bacterium]